MRCLRRSRTFSVGVWGARPQLLAPKASENFKRIVARRPSANWPGLKRGRDVCHSIRRKCFAWGEDMGRIRFAALLAGTALVASAPLIALAQTTPPANDPFALTERDRAALGARKTPTETTMPVTGQNRPRATRPSNADPFAIDRANPLGAGAAPRTAGDPFVVTDASTDLQRASAELEQMRFEREQREQIAAMQARIAEQQRIAAAEEARRQQIAQAEYERQLAEQRYQRERAERAERRAENRAMWETFAGVATGLANADAARRGNPLPFPSGAGGGYQPPATSFGGGMAGSTSDPMAAQCRQRAISVASQLQSAIGGSGMCESNRQAVRAFDSALAQLSSCRAYLGGEIAQMESQRRASQAVAERSCQAGATAGAGGNRLCSEVTGDPRAIGWCPDRRVPGSTERDANFPYGSPPQAEPVRPYTPPPRSGGPPPPPVR